MSAARDAAMTREAALIDAARTVQLLRRRGPRSGAIVQRIRRHVARALGCYPAWDAIQYEMALRLLEGEAIAEPLRLAA
jgi:hypothetical protein